MGWIGVIAIETVNHIFSRNWIEMNFNKLIAMLPLLLIVGGCSKSVACKIRSPSGNTILIVTRPAYDPPSDYVEGEVYDYSGNFIGMSAIGTARKKVDCDQIGIYESGSGVVALFDVSNSENIFLMADIRQKEVFNFRLGENERGAIQGVLVQLSAELGRVVYFVEYYDFATGSYGIRFPESGK